MTPKDWTLLVVASAGTPVSPVQLQKMLFLLGRNLTREQLNVDDRLYHFEAYDYGPFDSSVYHDAEQLERDGLLRIDNAGSRYRSYVVTDEGLTRAHELRAKLETKVAAYLDRIMAWVSSLSFNELVEAIYKAYPDMAKNSVFRR